MTLSFIKNDHTPYHTVWYGQCALSFFKNGYAPLPHNLQINLDSVHISCIYHMYCISAGSFYKYNVHRIKCLYEKKITYDYFLFFFISSDAKTSPCIQTRARSEWSIQPSVQLLICSSCRSLVVFCSLFFIFGIYFLGLC